MVRLHYGSWDGVDLELREEEAQQLKRLAGERHRWMTLGRRSKYEAPFSLEGVGPDQYLVRPGPYIGLVPISGEKRLECLPYEELVDKSAPENPLLRFLRPMVASASLLEPSECALAKEYRLLDKALTQHADLEGMSEPVHLSFCQAALKVIGKPSIFAYQEVLHIGPKATGRLLHGETARHWARGRTWELACLADFLEEDNEITRLICAAAAKAMQTSSLQRVRDEASVVFRYFASKGVPAAPLRSRPTVPRRYIALRSCTELAWNVLRGNGSQLNEGASSISPTLFNGYQLFQHACAGELRQQSRRMGKTIDVLYQAEYNFADPRRNIYPDIVIKNKAGAITCVIDPKFKVGSVQPEDLYQLFFYAKFFQLDSFILVYPMTVGWDRARQLEPLQILDIDRNPMMSAKVFRVDPYNFVADIQTLASIIP